MAHVSATRRCPTRDGWFVELNWELLDSVAVTQVGTEGRLQQRHRDCFGFSTPTAPSYCPLCEGSHFHGQDPDRGVSMSKPKTLGTGPLLVPGTPNPRTTGQPGQPGGSRNPPALLSGQVSSGLSQPSWGWSLEDSGKREPGSSLEHRDMPFLAVLGRALHDPCWMTAPAKPAPKQ